MTVIKKEEGRESLFPTQCFNNKRINDVNNLYMIIRVIFDIKPFQTYERKKFVVSIDNILPSAVCDMLYFDIHVLN